MLHNDVESRRVPQAQVRPVPGKYSKPAEEEEETLRWNIQGRSLPARDSSECAATPA